MRILITGGNGFIGSNIVKKLTINNHYIYSLPKDCTNIKETVIEFNPDVLIHCGWHGGNSYNDINNPDQFYKNINYSIELIEGLTKIKKKTKFIGFGSFAEYGPKNNIIKENEQEHPTDLYGLSKYTIKQYSELLCNQNNIEWAWVRPCYVYGPGDVNTRLIPNIINKLLKNENVNLDNCDKIIDYIYIDDFVSFVYSLIIGNINGVYNICSGQQYYLKDIVNKIGLIMNKSEKIHFNNFSTRELTSHTVCGNNDKIKEQSQITELIDLDTGLLKTIKTYEELSNHKR
jgi:nucleoside-diphosphate-sugar epimerase